jgi:hypothetical protein
VSGYRPIKGTDYVYYDSGDISDERRIFARSGGYGIPLGTCEPTGDEPGWDVYPWRGRKSIGHARSYREAVELLQADRQQRANKTNKVSGQRRLEVNPNDLEVKPIRVCTVCQMREPWCSCGLGRYK